MAQGLPRTLFNGSGLARVLTDLAVADVPESKQCLAGRLGQWLDLTDALSLFSALNADTGAARNTAQPAPSPESAAVREAFERVRSALLASVNAAGASGSAKARIEWPAPTVPVPEDSAAGFAPYRRYYLAHQRDMNAGIGPLRATVRAALSRQSPALKRLAVLDAVLEKAFAARERELLATVPELLARRFDDLHKAHRAAVSKAPTEDDAGASVPSGEWLAMFCAEMRAVLTAELDFRLQPIAGMIAALDNEVAR